jgi:5-methylcytosine-specific restriction protein A
VLPFTPGQAAAARLPETPALPIAPPHPCATPRCPGLARRGHRCCDSCEQAGRDRRDDAARGTAAERGYKGEWPRTRKRILERDHYLCRYCQNVDRLTEATLVDHVRPKSCNGTDDDANLASCCRDCHAEKTIKHDGGYGRPVDPIDRVDQFVPTWSRARGAA